MCVNFFGLSFRVNRPLLLLSAEDLVRRMAKKVNLSSLRRDFSLVINPMVDVHVDMVGDKGGAAVEKQNRWMNADSLALIGSWLGRDLEVLLYWFYQGSMLGLLGFCFGRHGFVSC